MVLTTIYIFISEGEKYASKDVEKLIDKKIFSLEEISSDSSVLVCISRDYIKIDHGTPAVVIRDQLSNVFCPDWRINSVKYKSLLGIMNFKDEQLPEIKVITENLKIYNNLDYYLHLSNFQNRSRLFLESKKRNVFEPIESNIGREDIKDLGLLTLEVCKLAGYDKDINDQVPGWAFQVSNPWMTRLLDLYEISPRYKLDFPKLTTLKINKDLFVSEINNPLIIDSPRMSDDLRNCIIDSFEVRKILMKLTKELLDKIS